MTWQEELVMVEEDAGLADEERASRRRQVGGQFLAAEAYPLLKGAASALADAGFSTEVKPSDLSEVPSVGVMLGVRSGGAEARLARSPTMFHVSISPSNEMIVRYWKPFNDQAEVRAPFGFLSEDRLRDLFDQFLEENDLLDAAQR